MPVLFVNDRKAFKYRCTPAELRQRLAREVRPEMPARTPHKMRVIFVTAGSEEQAVEIARTLVT